MSVCVCLCVCVCVCVFVCMCVCVCVCVCAGEPMTHEQLQMVKVIMCKQNVYIYTYVCIYIHL